MKNEDMVKQPMYAVSGSVPQMYKSEPKPVLQNTGYHDLDLFLDDCFKTMREKGHDYRQGNDADLLHNFRTVSKTVGVPMEKVWLTYFYKHYSAMTTYIKEGGQQESEPIEGRIKDQIVYLLLFYRMVKEEKERRQEEARQVKELCEKIDFVIQKTNNPVPFGTGETDNQ